MTVRNYIREIPVDCPDCHWSGTVEAEIHFETAFWTCPSTWCERQLIDPTKATDWYDEEEDRG